MNRKTGFHGTFVVSWSQTEIDGLKGAPVSSLQVGATWRWHGAPIRVDGANDVLVLRDPEGEQTLRERARRVARRLVGARAARLNTFEGDEEHPLTERVLVVTDGRKSFHMMVVDTAQADRLLVVFLGDIPPPDRDLWIAEPIKMHPPHQPRGSETGVICFAKGTFLRTPNGARRVEDLTPGDMVDTRDGGAQPIQWVGHRWISGIRLQASPGLRPIRLRTGALGVDQPSPDLIVSPQHRLLVRGDMAEALFNTNEVLVAAKDMINDRNITVDHGARDVTYYHILLPAHHVIWANGVASESFHPGFADLQHLSPDQHSALVAVAPELATAPQQFGEPARRMLTRPEAAILLHRGRGRGLAP